MSIYVMTAGELAKKRGEPVGEFVKKLQSLGVDAGSHAKRFTQPELDVIVGLLDGSNSKEAEPVVEVKKREIANPNVLLLKSPQGGSIIAFVDASVNEDGTLSVEVVSQRTENSLGDSLLEFRKQLGIKMGVN